MSLRDDIQDQILVLRCQQGDAAAFAALFDRWQPRLVHLACRLTGDREAAWDAVQETWMAVTKGLGRLDDVEAFATWIFRILNNKCNDWARKQQSQRRLHDGLVIEQQGREESPATPDRRYDTVREAMAALPPADGALLTLYYIENLGVAAIAEIVGVPAGTVKSRLYHARNRLRAMLKEKDHE